LIVKLREMRLCPKGYFFVEVEIADPAAYEAYRTSVPDIISLMEANSRAAEIRNRWMASCRTAAGYCRVR